MTTQRPAPTPIPALDGAGEDVEPQQLTEYLRTVIATSLSNPRNKIPVASRQEWMNLITQLTDHFIVSFPIKERDTLPWNVFHEKINLVEASLEVMSRCKDCVEGLFNNQDGFAMTLFSQLCTLCLYLETWVDAVPPPTVEPAASGATIPTPPDKLRDVAFDVAGGILKTLSLEPVTITTIGEPSWIVLRNIIDRVFTISDDLFILAPTSTYPLSIDFNTKPHVRDASVPRTTPGEGPPHHMTLLKPGHALRFHQVILSLVSEYRVPVHALLPGLERRRDNLAEALMGLSLSSQYKTSPSIRARCLEAVIRSEKRHSRVDIILLWRLGVPEKPYMARLDQALVDAIGDTARPLSCHNTAVDIMRRLRIRLKDWDEGNKLREAILAYLERIFRNTVNKRDREQLKLASETIPELAKLFAKTASSVAKKGEELQQYAQQWRTKVRELVERIVHPQPVNWMDEDKELPDEEFATRAVDDVSSWLQKTPDSAPPSTRLTQIQALLDIIRLLPHPTSPCSGASFHPPITISTSIIVPGVTRLLDNLVQHRRLIYALLPVLVEHQAEHDSPEQIVELAIQGMSEDNRSLRIQAGKAIVVLLKVNQSTSVTNMAFSRLESILEHGKDTVKETVLPLLGALGQSATKGILGKVVTLLITELGDPNLALRGMAFMQLSTMARSRKVTYYNLLSPYMPEIAVRLVEKKALLTEACRFTGMQPSELLKPTLVHTLPQMFAQCDSKALDAIAREVHQSVYSLFCDHPHVILAHIFMQQTSGATSMALHFVVTVLKQAAENSTTTKKNLSTIDNASVVKAWLAPLLAELVITTGDLSPGREEMAMNALQKVQKALITSSSHGKGSSGQTMKPIEEFLKQHMLSVIMNLNETLQDFKGKKTVTLKQQIIRSLGKLTSIIGPSINTIAPQMMATLQTMLNVPELADVTLDVWHKFMTTLAPSDAGPHVGPTSAAFVSCWPHFSEDGRQYALKILEYIICDIYQDIGLHMDEVVDLSTIPSLQKLHAKLKALRRDWSAKEYLQRTVERSSNDNLAVAIQSLSELKSLMLGEHRGLVAELASGDVFDPFVGQILAALLSAACRDGDGSEQLRLLAYECIGVLGAVDPDRCEIKFNDPGIIMLSNFEDEGESVLFALHLIQDVLVGAFRSTSDMMYQSHLAYTIQELLKFCKFTPALVAEGPSGSVPMKVRKRWDRLPKHVIETVAPLLDGHFFLKRRTSNHHPVLPIYPTQTTYREWIQLWTTHLIGKASGGRAPDIFGVFHSAVRNRDVGVARHLLPHLMLNILISGSDDNLQAIRSELLAVLQDQIDPESKSTADKKLLSAQVVFILLDHLGKWVRTMRQDMAMKQAETKRGRNSTSSAEEQVIRVDSILSSIDQNLMARAALQCRAYARSLMSFERQIVSLRTTSPQSADLPEYYERLHQIYAHLDEPDGMEGVSTMILSPSLEHKIRQHESTGNWTSALSCWEIRLQQAPDNLDFHLGLLRCLQNLGHYDTLRTHVKGILVRNPDWEHMLVGFQVEGARMAGAWDEVQLCIEKVQEFDQTPSIAMAKLLLALRAGDSDAITAALRKSRLVFGTPITAAGAREYRRSYEAVLGLHLTHELEMIYGATSQKLRIRASALNNVSVSLASRLDSTLPTFRMREPILSMRRTAFALAEKPGSKFPNEIGLSWLASAKIARKARQWQVAYSALLRAQQQGSRFSFIESSKLVKATGEPLKALQELDNSLNVLVSAGDDVVDLTEDGPESSLMTSKAQVLKARWMNESDRFPLTQVLESFQAALRSSSKWESGQYHLGQFHDDCYKNLSESDRRSIRGLRMCCFTVKSFVKALKYGSKYVYRTLPRLLTLWLDVGEDMKASATSDFSKMNEAVSEAIKTIPAFKWFTAFPQIVSRVGHGNPEVYATLSRLIETVIQEYPNQALWLFTSVVKSTKRQREQRGNAILASLKANPHNANTQVPILISDSLEMTNELLELCNRQIDDHKKTLKMSVEFPRLAAMGNSQLLIPLQDSLTASLPPTSSTNNSAHQPFPVDAPTFAEFFEEIDIMRSLAKPRKITIRGSNGQIYMFLGKPKDDLRKDARLMDFNTIINKLLKANSDSRRRQLHIRTYGVVTLNEECGFIQWVPNTIPLRPVLIKSYDALRVKAWSTEMGDVFKKVKEIPDKEAGKLFVERILPKFPPVFHEWFIETFPEPSAWLASRIAYSRTAAVMSMVGFILGLGDRHCENILLDMSTGDVVHVDFNCLFEKGKTLEIPERVPFRLTQNIVDGFGVTGVEGFFRIACEITFQILHDHRDSLMSVLDAFVHDPLVEWEDEKRKLDRDGSRRNHVKSTVDLRMLAKHALHPIEKKLKGIYVAANSKEKHEREVTTSNLVQILIQESTDHANLAKMYPGWAAWH